MRCVRIRVRGKVQGVFYRASTRDKAVSLGLKGWVRNCPDGSVEAEAVGDDDAVAQLIAWCRRGPENAIVQEVEVNDFESDADYDSFTVRR